MAIIILIICFSAIFLQSGSTSQTKSTRQALIESVLIFSVVLVLVTELLSLFAIFNFLWLTLSWSLITVVCFTNLYLNRRRLSLFLFDIKTGIRKKLTGLTLFEKAALTLLMIILLLIFIQALAYPPNNWDSMTYHMARITSWVAHRSLAYFPTSTIRQLYQPPFAEYVIMNFGLLSHSDIFSNLVQFLFFLFSLIVILLITEELGLKRRYKIIALLLAATIPEVVLEAGSTQNDVVEAFFILATFWYAVKVIKGPGVLNFVFVGIAIGLGLLTKGTAYIFLPPVLLYLAVLLLVKLYKTRSYRYLSYSLIAAVMAVLINIGQYSRNYKLTNNILGVDITESAMYSNQKMSAALLLSGIVKNAGLHMAVMFYKPAAASSNRYIYKLHEMAGININDPATNYRNLKFSTGTFITSEDGAANPFHFILIIITLLLIIIHILKGKVNFMAASIALIMLLQAVFFCLYLKWQPWHSRLHIPLFLLAIPLISYALSISSRFRKVFYILLPVIAAYAVIVVLHSEYRPYTGTMLQGRYKKYFVGNALLYKEYSAIRQNIQLTDQHKTGLISGVDSWEYPLFNRCFSHADVPVYISVDNFSKAAAAFDKKVDCIVSDTIRAPYIDYDGRRFINQTPQNKLAWVYK